MKLVDSNPRPEEFPLGSPESRAAARLLVEKRRKALIPVMCTRMIYMGGEGNPPPLYVECQPELIGSNWSSWMTRQELEAAQREYEEYEAAQCSVPNDAHESLEITALPEAHEPSPLYRQAPICEMPATEEANSKAAVPTLTVRPQEPEPDYGSPDERVRQFIARRRKLARRGQYRRHRWPLSAYGL
jgi:hypothetical protein